MKPGDVVKLTPEACRRYNWPHSQRFAVLSGTELAVRCLVLSEYDIIVPAHKEGEHVPLSLRSDVRRTTPHVTFPTSAIVGAKS